LRRIVLLRASIIAPPFCEVFCSLGLATIPHCTLLYFDLLPKRVKGREQRPLPRTGQGRGPSTISFASTVAKAVYCTGSSWHKYTNFFSTLLRVLVLVFPFVMAGYCTKHVTVLYL
jgi:hypothetical protein